MTRVRVGRAIEKWSVWIWPALLPIAVAIWFAPAACADTVTIAFPLDASTITTSESNFGNMVSDAILAAVPDADFALCPAAEIDPVVIDAGKVDTDRITSALRAQSDPTDSVEVVTLTGAQVREALVHAVSRVPVSYEGFLQVSGLTVRYDPSKRGAERIVSVIVSKTGHALDPHATYKVAMPRYLADGALGYFEIWANAAIADTHTAMTDAVVRFATSNQPVSYHVEGRLSKK